MNTISVYGCVLCVCIKHTIAASSTGERCGCWIKIDDDYGLAANKKEQRQQQNWRKQGIRRKNRSHEIITGTNRAQWVRKRANEIPMKYGGTVVCCCFSLHTCICVLLVLLSRVYAVFFRPYREAFNMRCALHHRGYHAVTSCIHIGSTWTRFGFAWFQATTIHLIESVCGVLFIWRKN